MARKASQARSSQGRHVSSASSGAPPPAGAAGPRYVADTTTWAAFVAVPPIGIAPFSKLAPSAGESTVSVGACTTEKGTLKDFYVTGSVVQPCVAIPPPG